jgi:pseudouridine-5'-phosphate glycosidase
VVRVADDVAAAVADGSPVVALESTIFSHGLPRPRNLEVARELESILREAGVVPATVGLPGGVPTVGLSAEQLGVLATAEVTKASVRDLPLAMAAGRHAATTVASTAVLARAAGVRVFATGGIGGVHRGAAGTFDESADLPALACTPITVVSAGAKSVLDVPATLERLETLGVAVVGFRTKSFPGFFVADSGLPLDWEVASAGEVAAIMRASDGLGGRGALLVANPVPVSEQLDPVLHEQLLADALAAASAGGIAGKEVTPFLLDHLQRESGGATLEANIAAVRNNVRVAAEIAIAFAAL